MNDTELIFELAGWSAPSHVRALTTQRIGGVSKGVFNSLNLGSHVGDDPVAVAENRRLIAKKLVLPSNPIWLSQIHSNKIVNAEFTKINEIADGSYATRRGIVCAILTADCIPLFLTDQLGTRVCVLHIGWRGLAAGIIEQALSVMDAKKKNLIAWIGPGIGPDAFVINNDVWKLLTAESSLHRDAFVKHGDGWLANLGQMVGERLELAGVSDFQSSQICTFKDPAHWFSYRRDGSCGRMASLIWMT
tara:strand:+ start:12237 stop:12977 length:741 start_codon:yes stop_codon:yes gene_type:complete